MERWSIGVLDYLMSRHQNEPAAIAFDSRRLVSTIRLFRYSFLAGRSPSLTASCSLMYLPCLVLP
jgi:hypothetical protein